LTKDSKKSAKRSDKAAKKVKDQKALLKALEPDWKRTKAAKVRTEAAERTGRALEIGDLYAWSLVGEPQVSPDGTRVVAEVLTIDKESDEYRSTLWNIPLDGGEPTKLTSGQWSDTSPRWSPDGTFIAFTSNRIDKKSQIFVLPVAGGEAQQVTRGDESAGDFVWAPDSDRIAFVRSVAPTQDEENEDEKSDVKVITSARYKFDGRGFLEDKVAHIFLTSVSGKDDDPEQLTDGHFDHSSPAWSPNGTKIAFVANRDEDWDKSRHNDLWVLNVESKDLRKLTDGKGAWRSPAWSPDGSNIAVGGDADVARNDVNAALYVIPAEGGEPQQLSAGIDRTIGDSSMSGPTGAAGKTFRWLPDGSAIDSLLSDRGSTVVVRFRLDGKKPRLLTATGRHIKAFDHVNDGDSLVIAVADQTTPMELHLVREDDETPLTSFNEAWLSEVSIPAPEEFWVESNGDMIQGWLIRPEGNTAESTDLAPLILNIHGGPHAQFSNAFFHELQMYVARGNALVYINPRGSTGRTDDFAKAVQAAWGKADMPDFIAAVDHVLSLGGLDPERLGVTGGSYGGFSTNWILGHSDRFKAAVTDRSISNIMSMSGTDDIALMSLDPELGLAWENHQKYWDMSPLKYVGNVNTPCLIIHSENDHRCPMEQAEQWFMALKRLDVPTEFVRFPDESHGLGRNGKPKHRVERLERTLGWFDKYL
jgi:dipeptidyl aminopeptidase/acylaminoacyl peptidase